MARCSGIRVDGGRCGAQAIRGSEYCVNHHPDCEDARRRRNSKGASVGAGAVHLSSSPGCIEALAAKVLTGEIERGVGAVAGQLLNGARACVRDALAGSASKRSWSSG
jgi:hypothetical protein